ncbi:hypothetical protein NEOLEDRAFT_1144177 [Neolentinus lepideus HHB14362 ss-1]|uniref:Uncharacterized protein n=1 Tax=Neolentinus lepideus HHB14362 ss-1 TaxID=1314782 RepID=A0A165W271_9AGAM|nr:hypothetical protein NEOLEDRAFT_1144177 [Neolentinus lepideus HHB14362 ss-1]
MYMGVYTSRSGFGDHATVGVALPFHLKGTSGSVVLYAPGLSVMLTWIEKTAATNTISGTWVDGHTSQGSLRIYRLEQYLIPVEEFPALRVCCPASKSEMKEAYFHNGSYSTDKRSEYDQVERESR